MGFEYIKQTEILLFCIHYTFVLEIMYIGFAIAAFAIKYSMLYSLPEKAEIIEKKQSSIFSVIVDMKLFVAVKRSAKKLEGT